MDSATLNLRISPRRMLPVKEAAVYCGIAVKRFSQECRVPPVAMPGGSKLYDIRDLDTWLDGLKSGHDADDEILGRLG